MMSFFANAVLPLTQSMYVMAAEVPPATTPLPAPRCDWVPLISPISNYIVGNLRGFGPWFAIVLAVGLTVTLLVVAPAAGPRRYVMLALGALLGFALLAGAIIAIVPQMISTSC
jgi:hypothetical protein